MQTKMFRRPGALAIALAFLCVPALPLGAQDENVPTRPIKATGYATVTVTPDPLTYPIATLHWDETGNATHVGLYTNTGDGTMDLSTGAFLSMEGVTTAANGDTFNWVYQEGTTVISGGTGRFENASWSFVPNLVSMSEPVLNPDGTFTIYLVYTVDTEGTF